jgi:nucleoside-diphosphate-sugar epimerase
MARVIVTGGSGKVGRACVQDLLEHGYEVFNIDLVQPAKELCRFIHINLTDFGETIESLSRIDELYNQADAVVHLAAIPAPARCSNSSTFRTNTLSTYNVFEAARTLKI